VNHFRTKNVVSATGWEEDIDMKPCPLSSRFSGVKSLIGFEPFNH